MIIMNDAFRKENDERIEVLLKRIGKIAERAAQRKRDETKQPQQAEAAAGRKRSGRPA